MGNKIVSTGEVTTVILPSVLKAAVRSEAKDQGVSMTTIVRWALKDRYQRQAQAADIALSITDAEAIVRNNGDLQRLIQAYLATRVTAQEVADRLVIEEHCECQSHSVK